ncbi:hypothetical protein [Mycobacterium kiyosense]|uniref:PNPLA domain-containing protein n=2 Tax=Mycobacterium TaxID=1763 RepID=A0A9P3QB89_9MYCO|nr:hypothetical protein [Mycobacterium kiyosense]BDE13646.1 hypothetical protein MKCMC460_25060 [Mycobacterium sp. 20KCMC460]BDB43145.1 hypothetical protein IWGMT90018_35910 [Mycobacterium kiyosense]GLB85752.1 hypothetical protein SRL2020028_50080 [Mycobacterium kiyosense]GLB91448.1 hypothetical protein SRL2020130_42650 [Mycobacterium kiyosense]GLB98491.1 hypothetical protein SRL2020226_52670 [Mycobacterium kiyosense]
MTPSTQRLLLRSTPLVTIVGAALLVICRKEASPAGLERYTFGDRNPVPAGLDDALFADIGFIAGYGLVLGAFVVLLRAFAISSTGRAFANYARAAVLVTLVADATEDVLLYLSTYTWPERTALATAAAAAATIKWCAALLAVLSVPGACGALLRWGWAWLRTRLGKETHWWHKVLADEGKSAVPASLTTAETTWAKAYHVPGATAQPDNGDRDDKDLPIAICLSGGGVRSACVAMGATQVFARADYPVELDADAADTQTQRPPRNTEGQPKLLDSVDYIISVSGGGYTAGARLLAVQPDSERPAESGKSLLSQRFGEGSAEFDHMRRHSSYIADSPSALLSAFAQVLKNLLASLVTLLAVPVIVGSLLGYLLANPRFPIAAFVPVGDPLKPQELSSYPDDYFLALTNHVYPWWAIGFFASCAVVFTMLALVIECVSEKREAWRIKMTRWALGCAMFGLLIFAITVAMPELMHLCASAIDIDKDGHAQSAQKATGFLTGVVGLQYLAAIVAIAWKKRGNLPATAPSTGRWKSLFPPGVFAILIVLATLAALAAVWLMVLGSFAAGIFYQVTLPRHGAIGGIRYQELWLLGLVLTVGFLGFADVTSLSLHPFYRRRLASAFAVRREVPRGSATALAAPYPAREPTWLHDYGEVTVGKRPEFVFAAAAAISGEGKPAPGLNAVSFVLGAKHIGGPQLGWLKTEELWHAATPRLRRDMTVQAAVAISGAAFASAMGRQNKGFQKLLAVSGARLGTWLPNPRFVANLRDSLDHAAAGKSDHHADTRWWPQSLPTIRGAGYFYRELFGINNRDARLVQVTDGGHYENLGLVEALRRRCRLIYCIDGGGDAPPLLSGLSDAIRLAKYELGVDIILDEDGQFGVGNLAPGSGRDFTDNPSLAALNSRVTRGLVAKGTITYPKVAGVKGDKGTLIFAKAVLWRDCPDWLLTYAAAKENAVFPHDPTSDQWFTEGQFAAYCELGRLAGTAATQCAATLHGVD